MNYSLRRIENGWLVSGLVGSGGGPLPVPGERYYSTLALALEAIAANAASVQP